MNKLWLGVLTKGRGHKNRLWHIGFLGLWLASFLVLSWIVWSNWELLVPYLLNINYVRLAGMFPTYVAAYTAAAIGWVVIMRVLARQFGWWTHVRIYCTTLAARRLPGTIWYVGGRILLYERLGVSAKLVSYASGIELVVTITAGVIVGLVSIGLGLQGLDRLLLVSALPAAAFMFLYLGNKALLRLMRGSTVPPDRVGTTFLSLAPYAMSWIMGGVMVSQLISVFMPIGPEELPRIIGLWSLAGAAGGITFFLPSSLGITELALTALLSQTIPIPLAAVTAVLTRILTTLFELVLAAVFYPFSKG